MASISSIPSNIFHFFRESKDELRKVTWPSRQTTLRYTVIVIGASIAVGLVIGGIDFGLTKFIETLIF